MSLRSVEEILPPAPQHWVGDGFHVHPVFSTKAFTEAVSPFLLFDYAPPKPFKPNKKRRQPPGVGKHPHRGFETVTLAFQGEVEHADSAGHRDVVRPGDVQWMTAGRGIVHEEFHSMEFSKAGGVFEMAQLWVNLPKRKKTTKPRYQPILSTNIPAVGVYDAAREDGEGKSDDPVGSVRVIAGSFQNAKGPAKTFSPVELWDVTVDTTDATVDLPFPPRHTCIVFVRRGKIDIVGEDGATKRVGPQEAALMKREGEVVRIRSGQKNTSVLIMGGLPLNEPIAAEGPFVMNTMNEVRKAKKDYQAGKFGR